MKSNQNFQYISFNLAHTLMGVDILDIREIVPSSRITRVQLAPWYVLGLVNLRGQILTILDIRVLLGLESPHQVSGGHVIVFKYANVGFAVDGIGDVSSIDREKIEPVPANATPGVQTYADAVINLHEGVMVILNAHKILSCARTESGLQRSL
ncbi:MAG: chemotaxis protein CheW [Desulfobacteraceae bacterium]|jgi:purine-binding chemotaxis protein CheW|nr:chemotaxis protein CheW [Desulfobacteraceae bacterium]